MANNALKELRELLAFGLAVQNGLVASLEDGKIDARDLPNIWGMVSTAGPAFNDLGNPVDRLNELTKDELRTLGREAAQGFDIPDDVLEGLTERTIGWAYGAYLLGKEWAQYIKARNADNDETEG